MEEQDRLIKKNKNKKGQLKEIVKFCQNISEFMKARTDLKVFR